MRGSRKYLVQCLIISPDRKISTSIVGFWSFLSNLIIREKNLFRFFYLQNEMHLQLVWGFYPSIFSIFCVHDKLIFFSRCRFQCIRNINQFKTNSAVLRQTTCALSWDRNHEKKKIKLISICRLDYITNFNFIGSDRKSKVQTLNCLRCVGCSLAFHINEKILV